MRKQTKIAAIVSAAALLAVGASMTSFAATGWQEEDGTWVYYNKSEEKVTDKWAKSGDNWFFLDSDGYMATDMLIEDDEDYYYVDANGAMVRNQWIAIDNEDAGNDDSEPEVHWYYFQNNGKAYRKKGDNTFKKSINGKTYCFNEEGQMQFGWVKHDEGETDAADDAWKTAEDQYYFGDENDGAMAVGWKLISIVDEDDADGAQPGDSFWDEDQDRWFYFKSSGKKQTKKDGKTINGRKYGFDEYGRMVADWANLTDTDADGKKTYDPGAPASASLALKADKVNGAKDIKSPTNAEVAVYTREFQYFSSPEDGARYSKAWFKVIPGAYLDDEKYDDGESKWYYADGKGHLIANEIKTIKGKKYAFDERGRMVDGLKFMFIDSSDTKKIEGTLSKDDYYSDEDAFKDRAFAEMAALQKGTAGFYFFSDDADHDGSMKTGKQTIDLDGDKFTFRFYDSGARKGQGITGVKDKKIYLGGMQMKADSDNKIEWLDTQATSRQDMFKTFDDLKGYFNDVTTDNDRKKDQQVWEIDSADADEFYARYIPMNSSGAVITSGTKKDGDDYKITFKGTTSIADLWGSNSTLKYGKATKVVLK